jgi:uncharacterized cupin superfamily protein
MIRTFSIVTLLGCAIASAGDASSSMSAGGPDPVVFGRLSGCVADPASTARVLEDLLGWRSTVSLPNAHDGSAKSGSDTVIVSDLRGFQLELMRGSDCGVTPFKRLSFVAQDLGAVLKRSASIAPASSGTPRMVDGVEAPVSIPAEVSAGTPVTVMPAPRQVPVHAPGAGAIRVDRIAIFVSDIERSARFYTGVLGLRRNPGVTELDGAANARSGGLKVAFIDANGVWLALVQPVGDGPLMDYLRAHGDGHIAELILETDDLGAFYDRMKARGISLVDTRGEPVDPQAKAHILEPYGDRIAYLPSARVGGLVIELAQRGPPESSLLERRDRAGAEARASGAVLKNHVTHGPWASFLSRSAPAYGGREGVIYRSPDGTRVAGAFTHSGRYSYTFPFDEFVYVTSGSVQVSVRDGNSFTLKAGDVAYFREGITVDFVADEDYGNVAMFVDEQPVHW